MNMDGLLIVYCMIAPIVIGFYYWMTRSKAGKRWYDSL